MTEQGHRMQNLIEDMLTLTRLESIETPLRPERVAMGVLMEQVLQEGIEKKKIANSVRPAEMSVIIHDLWNGAMQRSAVCRDATPPREALNFIRTLLTP